MAEKPRYVILGRGRWAKRMQNILVAERHCVVSISDTRRTSDENDTAYRVRLAEAMNASRAQVAWLCVPPGPHVHLMIEAALDASLHVVVEKPWQASHHVTRSLLARARSLRRLVAVHFEYCFLENVEKWRRDFHTEAGLRFGGHFFHSGENRSGIGALDNLGSHLLAIRAYAAPQSTVHELCCGYDQPDERAVWLEKEGTRVAFIDFLENKEPIIERFIGKVEASLEHADFPLDLEFALRVSDDILARG